MGLFNRRESRGAALAEPPAEASAGELLSEIRRHTAANRDRRDRETERRLLALRHRAGLRLIEEADGGAYPEPELDALPAGPLPEIQAADATPGLIRAGILRDGALLVRGLVPRDAALALAEQIDRAFAERERAAEGRRTKPGYYEEFEPDARFNVNAFRSWIRDGGGVLAADSPMLSYELLELFETGGLRELVGDYLGEAPLLSVHKTTLRKAVPTLGGAWHQDGAFMGDVRALNLWLSLSRCGDVAPGLDVVPRRLEEVVIPHDAMLDVELTRRKATEAAGEAGIVRPIFEPGDALFFDELFLHQTASDPAMPNPRYAVESWFFGASAFPGDYAPVAV